MPYMAALEDRKGATHGGSYAYAVGWYLQQLIKLYCGRAVDTREELDGRGRVAFRFCVRYDDEDDGGCGGTTWHLHGARGERGEDVARARLRAREVRGDTHDHLHSRSRAEAAASAR